MKIRRNGQASVLTPEQLEVKISAKLAELIIESRLPKTGYLFPGRKGGYRTRQSADLALRKACDYIGLKGVSSHSLGGLG